MSDFKTTAPMYVQQLKKLPFNDIDALLRRVKTLNAVRYALIIHDKDVDEDGKPLETHVHVMMQFDTAQRVSALANKLNDLEQNFESMTKNDRKNGVNNGFAYLTHRTTNAADRYQYDFSEVTANFDYPKFMAELAEKVKNTATGPDRILEDFKNGEITFLEARQELLDLSPRVYSSKARALREINSAVQDISAEQWRAKMRKNGQSIRVIWLYGAAGTGKTRFAETIGGKLDDPGACFTTGGSNDMFQDYAGQHSVVLDELRPNVLQYADLLKILDPFNYDMRTVSRYHNLQLQAETIIVTSPYSPAAFFSKQSSVSITDGFGQLSRRISLTIEVTPGSLNEVDFTNGGYVATSTEPNPYYSPDTTATRLGLDQLLTDMEDD
ncbi:Rep family protein [Levilactobacillus cerevisiae]|uniref:Rep family protein n=1 Tax=Levilactobacillus cerevisiae TaxID=1704076 RepID=UPI000F795BE1|nr:Rep family protein [Levilactobacillus cerevisiae]